MSRAVLALFLLMVAPLTAGSDWATVAKETSKSIVFVEQTQGSCTGFVINAGVTNKDKETVDYVLTAAHCDGPELYADQAAAKVVAKDTKKDLLVLEVASLNRPALAIAKDNPKIGEEVASYGYGWGLDRPMFRTAHVSDDKTYIPEDGIGGPLVVIDAQYVPGMSGGAVFNATGEVVSIVQRGGGGVGLGVGAETIRQKMGRWLAKQKP